jgi:hypothetical protein
VAPEVIEQIVNMNGYKLYLLHKEKQIEFDKILTVKIVSRQLYPKFSKSVCIIDTNVSQGRSGELEKCEGLLFIF